MSVTVYGKWLLDKPLTLTEYRQLSKAQRRMYKGTIIEPKPTNPGTELARDKPKYRLKWNPEYGLFWLLTEYGSYVGYADLVDGTIIVSRSVNTHFKTLSNGK